MSFQPKPTAFQVRTVLGNVLAQVSSKPEARRIAASYIGAWITPVYENHNFNDKVVTRA
jgi:hypothetical protein